MVLTSGVVWVRSWTGTLSGATLLADTAVVLGAASTSGIRLDLESGVLAVREGDDSAYARMLALQIGVIAEDALTGFNLSSSSTITWSTTADPFGSAAVGLSRSATGVVKVTNGGAGTGQIQTLATRLVPTAFASLPTATEGMVAAVTDSNTNTWGATIAGGGANNVLAFYNGSNWTVAGA